MILVRPRSPAESHVRCTTPVKELTWAERWAVSKPTSNLTILYIILIFKQHWVTGWWVHRWDRAAVTANNMLQNQIVCTINGLWWTRKTRSVHKLKRIKHKGCTVRFLWKMNMSLRFISVLRVYLWKIGRLKNVHLTPQGATCVRKHYRMNSSTTVRVSAGWSQYFIMYRWWRAALRTKGGGELPSSLGAKLNRG